MANVKITVETIDKGSGNVQKVERGLQDLLGTVGKLSAGVVAAGVVFKQAFDLSEEGANLNQLEQSFTYLNDTILKTPNLLEDLKAASHGTMTEAQMMAGVLKMVAGSSDEMAMKMAAASPQLLEIAKAAQKLNPTLGDTAYLYESITTGIKRGSPLILDNLGIVIKVEESYQRFAESIGKTVTELTSEERSMAILNATLVSGGNLIRQVGGDVSSQADAWVALRVQVEETNNAFKQMLAERNAGTVGGAADILSILNERQAELNRLHEAGAISTAQYRGATLANWTANRSLTDTLDEKIAALDAEEAATQASLAAALEAGHAVESWDRAMTGGLSTAEQFNEILSEQAEKYRMNAAIANDYQEASLEYEVTADMVKEAEDARAQAHEDAAKAMEEAEEAAQKARQAQADFFNSLVGNNEAMSEWNSIMGATKTVSYQVAGRTAEQSAALEDLQDAYKDAQETITSYQIGVKGVGLSEEERNEKIQEQLDYMAQLDAQMQPLVAIQNEYATATTGGAVNTELLNQKLFEQIQASTDDAAAIALAGVALGQFSEEQANAMLKAALLEEEVRKQAAAWDGTAAGLAVMQGNLAAFIETLNGMPSLVETEVRTNYTSTGQPAYTSAGVPNVTSGQQGGEQQTPRAAGGPVMAGHSYTVGEWGWEEFVPAVNGRVLSNKEAKEAIGGGGINIEQLIIHAQPGQDARQLAQGIMQELGRLTRQQMRGR